MATEKKNRINRDEMKQLMALVMTWVEKCEEMEACWINCIGEAKDAYALVYKDYQWKLQRSIGQLWYYVCGTEDLNPFDVILNMAKQKEEEEKEAHLQSASASASASSSREAKVEAALEA